jgi:glycosyltransferase involved in cell wall biosynthesis
VAEPPTVLFVDHASALGGAEHSLLALMTALDLSRFRPVLAAPPGPLADAASGAGVTVRRLPLARLQRQITAPFRLVRGVQALQRVAVEEQADLLHGNVLRASVYASLAARSIRRPLIWHVRDIHPPGLAARWLCHEADAVIAISHVVAHALPCRDTARVIDNPVAVPSAQPRSRAELGLPLDGTLVAIVASLRRWKGHEAFLDAAARVADPRARFVVIGGAIFDDDDPDYGPSLAARAAELGLGERVTFTGQRDDLADLWPHLAVLVHPAEAEPFGRVVAEAQLAGVPVVAFNDGGLPELVSDGESGLLVTPGDTAGLADAITRLLADPELRARLARAAEQRASRRFAPATHARAVEHVYEQLLASRQSGASHRKQAPA